MIFYTSRIFSFKSNALKLSAKLKNNPTNVNELFVKSIEYAATFDSNAEMNIPDLDFITYYNLDIYVPFLLMLLLLNCVVFCLVRRFVRLVFFVLFEKSKRE